MYRIAHIVNPFEAAIESDLNSAQKITFASMLYAKKQASHKMRIDLFSAQFESDAHLVPDGFVQTKNLERSVLNLDNFSQPIRLPLIADILERLYEATDADYLIYTNVDIGLYPNFYNAVATFIEKGYDSFIINRRRLKNTFHSVQDLPNIFQEKGKKHPGFDCFVFHRTLYPKLKLEGICIGVPFIEISFSQNLIALSKNFHLFDEEILTFHIGEEIFKKRMPKEYYRYNRKKYHLIERVLLPGMNINKFPYHHPIFFVRCLKWAIHPCFPIRLVLKLEWKQLKNILFLNNRIN
ncbi:MAG: hypothetical protein WCR21_07855 [Bacteroidota bacterium]